MHATYVFSVGPGSKLLAVRCDPGHAQPWPVGPTAIGQLVPLDRTLHEGKTKRQRSVTIDHRGAGTAPTVSGQTRTVTPYDYRMTDEAETTPKTTRKRRRRFRPALMAHSMGLAPGATV